MQDIIRRAVVVLLVLGAAAWMGPAASAEDPCPMEPVSDGTLRTYERQLLDLVQGARASAGVPAVSIDPRIVDIARRHAVRMASEKRVYHNPEYRTPSNVGATAIGEVPTAGCSVRDIHAKIMRSPADRDVVLTHQWRSVGIGMASDDLGSVFVVEAYAQPADQPSAPAPDPHPAPVAPTTAPRVKASVSAPPSAAPRVTVAPKPSDAPVVADAVVVALGDTELEPVAPPALAAGSRPDAGVQRSGILPVMAGALLGAAGAGRALVNVGSSARRSYRQRRRRTSAAKPINPKP